MSTFSLSFIVLLLAKLFDRPDFHLANSEFDEAIQRRA
jgi:hypothetical protein